MKPGALSLELDLSNGAADTYTVRGHCGNYGWSGTLILRQGQTVPGNKTRTRILETPPATCKKCGCARVRA